MWGVTKVMPWGAESYKGTIRVLLGSYKGLCPIRVLEGCYKGTISAADFAPKVVSSLGCKMWEFWPARKL